jgi:hypothetical protein
MDHIGLNDDNTAAGNRTHGQLLLAGDAQLAHDADIEGETELASNFECNRHASAGQAQHNGIVRTWVFIDLVSNHLAQRTASLPTVLKDDDHTAALLCIDCSP